MESRMALKMPSFSIEKFFSDILIPNKVYLKTTPKGYNIFNNRRFNVNPDFSDLVEIKRNIGLLSVFA